MGQVKLYSTPCVHDVGCAGCACCAVTWVLLLQAVVALPRILKPDETRLLWFYLKLGADALLLRGAHPLLSLLLGSWLGTP